MTSISVDKGNSIYDSRENCNAIIETASNTLILGCQNTIIPNTVTTIADGAFDIWYMTSITIPKSVTTIGHDAFGYWHQGHPYLTSINVDKDNPYYDSRENCNAIIETASNTLILGCQNTIIPNTVTTIADGAFDIRYMTSITIPKSVTTIGHDAFGIWNSHPYLTSINVDKDNPYYDSRENCNAIIETASNTLILGCQNTIIPNSVTTIGSSAFYDCENLTSITISKSVTSIGYDAFYGCKKLTSIKSLIEKPFDCRHTFDQHTFETATLYVPFYSIEAYQSTEGWKDFKKIVEIEVEVGTSIALSFTDENCIDVTNKVSIVWYDSEGKELGQGNQLNGIADSTEVYYSVLLDEAMGRVYREVNMQKVTAGDENVTCQLEKIGRVLLEGRVSATDIDKTTAKVSVKQMLNGKWEQNYTTLTNEQGVFNVEVYDDETDITISGEGYLEAMLHRDGFSENGNVGTIPLNLISGFSIAANITMQKAAAGSAGDVQTWTEGLNNIEFSLTNTTKDMAITDFTVQNGNVIIKTGADVGDEINLTAKSKQGIFADAVTTFIIADGANAFDLQLTEMGGIDATCANSGNGVTVGYLYNSNGVLMTKGTYSGETLSLRHLPSNAYTLITMGNSLLLGNMTQLDNIVSVGLKEGTDYVLTHVEVADGTLTAVTINEVPRLDETRFYYTSGDTYFNANKPSVTAGNYLTLQTHVDFKAEHVNDVKNVVLTIDLPEGCQMVANSVIANHQAVAHTVNGNRVTIPLTKEQYEGQVRFCVIPTLNQSYAVTAMATFDIDGLVTQPIGSAQFESKGLSLSVPEIAVNKNATINGTAKGHSEVSIYDNDVLIGKTTSKADGSWTAECELFKPYSHSFHDIYAKIITENGMELTSETRQVEYDKNRNVPEKVTMLYQSYKVDFYLQKGITSPSYYTYIPGYGDFTFIADFTLNDSTQIKNVNIKVLNSDGTVRTLPAIFDGKQNKWVATTKYGSSSRLPQNVAVEYDCIPNSEIYDEEMAEDMNTLIDNMLIEVENAYKDCAVELVKQDENSVYLTATTNGYGTKENFRITILDYEQVKTHYEDKLVCHISNDTTDLCFFVNIDNEYSSSLIVWDNLNMAACEIYSDGVALHANTSNRRRIIPFILSAVYGVGTAVFEYNSRMEVIALWRETAEEENTYVWKLCNRILQLLNAKCPDGSNKIKDPSVLNHLREKSNYFSNYTRQYLDDFHNIVERQQQRLQQLCIMKGGANVALSFISGPLVKYLDSSVRIASGWIYKTLSGQILDRVGVTALTEFASQSASWAVGIELDNLEKDHHTIVPEDIIRDWYVDKSKQIMDNYVDVVESIKGSYSDCKKEKEEEDEADEPKGNNYDDFHGDGATPSIDPSGYVYEAVTSNRLEGVTVTCYQKVQKEDMYGDITEEAVVWNAEDYSQQNPLTTDATGFYRWDVPQGLWQVKYEKEGYETTYSDWLPVPPPQLDVNISMKQSTLPMVKQMRGYGSGITIELSKYMRPATITTENITVTRNGKAERGYIELLNAEKAPLGGETYVSKVKFVPEDHFKTSDLVVVTVHKEAESYCGVEMAANHVETVKIEAEVKKIVADSALTVSYQGERELRVQVLPKEASAGKTLHIETSSQMIASVSATDVKIDNNGEATLTLSGELPGGAVLSYYVDGTDVTATTKVKVVMSHEAVATPIPSIHDGATVASGTLLSLTCATEGATIYYTLDGSCPCDEQARILYTGPIVLPTGTVTVNAIAVADGRDDSNVMTCIYNVDSLNSVADMQTDSDKSPEWHSLQGIHFIHKPTQPGIYLYKGRKILVK